jgi:hypothetical protein
MSQPEHHALNVSGINYHREEEVNPQGMLPLFQH